VDRLLPTKPRIVAKIFAEKIAAVAGVKFFVTNPRRVHVSVYCVAQPCVAAHELPAERVIKSATYPLTAHDYGVYGQRCFVASPHTDSGMITPATCSGLVFAYWNAKAEQDLFTFNPLFSQPFIVKAGGRVFESRQGQECLHLISRQTRRQNLLCMPGHRLLRLRSLRHNFHLRRSTLLLRLHLLRHRLRRRLRRQ